MADGERARWTGERMVAALAATVKARWFPLGVAALVVVLALPSLGVGWMIDDYYHRAILLKNSHLREVLGPPSGMFRFFRGYERTSRLVDIGLFPWWTDPNLKGEFLQALTVLTHRLDYALWPNSPFLMHAHNICWLAALVALTTCYYRQILGAIPTAAIAAFLFAVDDAHGGTVGFLANRNSLVAATFGVAALIAHDRFRRDGSARRAWLAPLLLSAALFSKEEGIGACAYLAAYALFLDPAGWRRGSLALSPHGLVVIVWAALRASWGYGVRDVGLYIDPLTDAARYLTAAIVRVPILLLGLWSPVASDFSAIMPAGAVGHFALFAAAYLAILLFAMAPLLYRDRVARFFAAGMILATLPVCATVPMDRLLTFAGIGAFGLLAQFWAFVFGGAGGAPSSALWRGWARGVAWLLVGVHAIFAPIALPVRAANPIGPRWIEERLYVHTPLGPSIADKTLVIVNAPSPANASYTYFRREQAGLAVPRYTRVLAPAIPSVTIGRLDERTIEIRPRGGYLRWALDRVFRSERRELARGAQVKLTGMTATVTAVTSDGRPAVATFQFDVPLESPELIWLCFRGGRFEPFTVPAVGQSIQIDANWKDFIWPTD
jgi:hypothetical protein